MEGYWDERYASGGESGSGSIGPSRTWKLDVIDCFLPQIDHVIDVGCGDLSFWEGRSCKHYTGIDISKAIIEKNREKRPDWNFIVSPAETHVEGLKSECVFCLDVLFHIMNDKTFIAVLNNLCRYATKYIIIYTWIRNPLTKSLFKRNMLNILAGVVKRNTRLIRDSLHTLYILSITPYTDGKYQYFRPLEEYTQIFERNGFKLAKKRENPDKFGALFIFKQTI
jgi:2-polyprenyl-3-methyl-5-hydroxy-6-metoxy-1,4-benzoquinol methylase